MENDNKIKFEESLIIKEEKIKIEEEEGISKELILHDECDIKIKLEKNADNPDLLLDCDDTCTKDFFLLDDKSKILKTIKTEDTDFVPHTESDSFSNSSDEEDLELMHFCQHCDFKTKYRGNLKQHQNAKHFGKIELCQFCGNEYKDRSNLNRHIRVVHLGNYKKSFLQAYNCIYCSFTTLRKENLRTHMNSLHTLENIFPCKICNYVGTRIDSYRRHMQAIHTPKQKYYKCSRCNFKSLRRDFFQKHFEENHYREPKFSCKFCEYKATFSCNLNRHIKRKHS